MIKSVLRKEATESTLKHWRGVTFDWSQPSTCVHLAHSHLTNFGYDLPEIPQFDTPLAAARAMRERGWDSVSNMLDQFLVRRRCAAEMRLGDLAVVEASGGLDAIFICAGPLEVFGWREDNPDLVLMNISLDQIQAVWEV